MIIKVRIGKSFGGCVRYVMNKKGAELLDYHGVRIESTSYVIKDFNLIKLQKPKVENVVWHSSVSFALSDKVTNELMCAIAKDYMQEIGLTNNQCIIVKHTDTGHQHFHIVANRVQLNGELTSDQWCKNRSARISDNLELKYKLTIAQQVKRVKPFHGTVPSTKKESKEIIRKVVEDCLKSAVNLAKLQSSLLKHGIELKVQEQSTGRINGISFKYKEMAFKGSSIHKQFSYKHIVKKLSSNKKKLGYGQ